jgi:ABC-type branched-subunit amino acid transport system substrate-binding protein
LLLDQLPSTVQMGGDCVQIAGTCFRHQPQYYSIVEVMRSRTSRRLLFSSLLIAFAATASTLAGCPRRFEPAAAPSITSPDAKANSSFKRAEALFKAGSLKLADEAFAEFARAFPSDTLLPLAQVYRGRIAILRGELAAARTRLSQPAKRPGDDPIGLQARYYLGLTLVRLGSHAQGFKLLAPYEQLVSREDRPEVLVLLAHAARQLKRPQEAARLLSDLYDLTDRPPERLYAKHALQSILAEIARSKDVRQIFESAKAGSVLAAVAGQRLAALESAAGNLAEAQRIRARIGEAVAEHAVESSSTTVRRVIGVLVPFTGRFKAAGQRMLAGAATASNNLASDKGGVINLEIRDTSQGPARAARELIERQHVVALAGTLDPKNAAAVAQVASSSGVPFVSLSRVTASPQQLATLRLLPDNRRRAEALAHFAVVKLKLSRLVTVRPDSRYGVAMAKAFADAVRASGATVVTELSYPPRARSFTELAKTLSKSTFDGLFVPDRVRSLTLLAPALARAGLWSGSPPSDKGRGIQLLATADGLTQRHLAASRRYLQGALLAPGFYPDETAAGSGPLIKRFRLDHGRPPSLLEALGFDSVKVLVGHLDRDPKSRPNRARLLADLKGRGVPGMTGMIRFKQDGQRKDPSLVYRVTGKEARLVGGGR